MASVDPPDIEGLKISVVTRNLTYKVRDGKKTWKTILNGVDFIAKPCQLTAIMGSSGSGKTTLLNVVAGRASVGRKAEVGGEVLFNGELAPDNINQFSNYVMQQDHLLEYLTVYETISISAKLKLKSLPREARRERVERVINELGLDECRNVRVGGEAVKGISGGQKKRVSIAIELLDEPSLLFLDEPTSGLDSSLAYDILKVLVDLANVGRTVICTVHQPRSQVFGFFDRLLLLSKGSVVFHGASADALPFFASLGYNCPSHFNPADFFLDVLSSKKGVSGNIGKILDSKIAEISSSTSEENLENPAQRSCSFQGGRVLISEEEVNRFPEMFKNSKFGNALEADIDAATAISETGNSVIGLKVQNYLNFRRGSMWDWSRSFVILCRRVWLNSVRNPMDSYIQLSINIVFGLIIGGLFFQLGDDGVGNQVFSQAANFAGLLFFVVTQCSFSQLEALLAFPRQRSLFNRETAGGLYRPSAFYAAQTFTKMPFQHIPALLFCTIVYWMAGLAPTAVQYFQFLLISFLTVFAAIGYCFMIGSSVADLTLVNIVAPTGLVMMMILSGYMLKDNVIPWWIGWAKYLSFMRYALFAFDQTQFSHNDVFATVSNNQILAYLGIGLSPTVW
eukprot:CAMPEP_0113844250 /NCGR_PEP_ID=MMETSP0372-20130328/143_1 /TAXON_ID=340204 /ORGANISM="Lankesteria abbotti" /LENGTH=622 /DNA_ID=CAMNT_0000813253 /DNA_START=125 /DNA_END=1990 /DNA_ORIENTATION=+ /assembly_acc=CAM_ASM_000359